LLKKHTDTKWILLYIERWLKAPLEGKDGSMTVRTKGTPQGGVISPLLANLYLHYAFDEWMQRNHKEPFERYADDIIVHCESLSEAIELKEKIEKRLEEYKLELNQEKTKIVYCKSSNRNLENYPDIQFDFLGYTFRPREVRSKDGKIFTGFNPGISNKASKKIRDRIRCWKIHNRVDKPIEKIAEGLNPVIKGWINYYGKFYRTELYEVLKQIDEDLIKWVQEVYRKSKLKAIEWINRRKKSQPYLFAHW